MYEVDFLPVGDGKDSGDAIALRFTRKDTAEKAVVIVDAGFKDDGEALVAHVKEWYDTDKVDLALLTHPDGDHIGGMGEVVRGLDVERLWLHRIGSHGGGSLPAAAAVEDLIGVALERGTVVEEAWAGVQAFGGALTILGPDKAYYEGLVAEQVEERGAAAAAPKLLEAARGLFDRIASSLPIEVPFGEKDVSPRNNTSTITMLDVDGRHLLLTGDAGVPALARAWDKAEAKGLGGPPDFVQVPHHGSRRNASSAWLDRLLGPTGQAATRPAFISVVRDSDKHPSGRVVNAYIRRGCRVIATAGSSKLYHHDAPDRGWGTAVPLQPMDESADDD